MQRYFSNELKDNKFILSDDDIYHIIKVMRMKDGDHVEVVYDKKVYDCCLENVNKNIDVKIVKELEVSNNNEPSITLIIPFLKEQKMDLILQKATELGVDEIVLTDLEHSIIRLQDNKVDNKLIRWQRIMKEASEQSMRVDIPTIKILKKNDIYNFDGLKIICSTKEVNNNIRNVLKKYNNYDKIYVVIGPEGGFSQKEEEEFVQNGFISTSLGNQILRVETVPLFILSIVRYEYME